MSFEKRRRQRQLGDISTSARNAAPTCITTTTASSTASIAIPLGAFDDPYFLKPRFSVWEERKHDWVEIIGDEIEHMD